MWTAQNVQMVQCDSFCGGGSQILYMIFILIHTHLSQIQSHLSHDDNHSHSKSLILTSHHPCTLTAWNLSVGLKHQLCTTLCSADMTWNPHPTLKRHETVWKRGQNPKVTIMASLGLSKLVWFHTQLSWWVSRLKSVVTHFLGSQSAVVVSHTKPWLPEPASAACSVGVTNVCRCTWWRWWCDISHLMLVWLM